MLKLRWEISINRIRLEFKYHTDTFFPDVLPRINRIRLEFKFHKSGGYIAGQEQVLIESDWNLNQVRYTSLFSRPSVLIESDWNLNFILDKRYDASTACINRIRLEFKYG